MSITLTIGRTDVPITKTVFPAGESCIRLDTSKVCMQDMLLFLNAEITFNFESNSEIFDLALVVDAVRRECKCPVDIYLYMPYLPYAQQDRVMIPGESLSSKVMCDFINSLNFTKVFCEDIHSDVAAAMINNLIHKKQKDCAYKLPFFCDPATTALVSPDNGAEKKTFDLAKQLGYTDIVRASKRRDVATGKIVSTKIAQEEYNSEKDLLIVDDMCIGGATFIELIKVLRVFHTGKISLYVTHGIFSAGLEVFEEFIDKIYVHNLMNPKYNSHPLIQVI